jgi:hypothetical protein
VAESSWRVRKMLCSWPQEMCKSKPGPAGVVVVGVLGMKAKGKRRGAGGNSLHWHKARGSCHPVRCRERSLLRLQAARAHACFFAALGSDGNTTASRRCERAVTTLTGRSVGTDRGLQCGAKRTHAKDLGYRHPQTVSTPRRKRRRIRSHRLHRGLIGDQQLPRLP